MARDKQAALTASDILDKAASHITSNHNALGINDQAAKKFAMMCDRFADHIEKSAGIDPRGNHKQALTGDDVFDEGTIGMDPEGIGEEVSGPLEQERDEPYMDSEFTQQENRELREKQQGGELGPDRISPVEQAARPGIQANLETGSKLAQVYLDINKAASKFAGAEDEHVAGLGTRLAKMGIDVLQFQARVLEGSESGERAQALIKAAGHVIPHLAGDVTGDTAVKLARMTDIVAGLAQAA